MYKLKDVRTICEIYYGREISKRTWIYWKRLAKIDDYAREIDEQKAGHLLAVAILRKRSPNAKITFVDVFKTALSEIKEIALALRNGSAKTMVMAKSCPGNKLTDYIAGTTGRYVSERSLYRWGKIYGIVYGKNLIYQESELEIWRRLAENSVA